MKVPSKRSLNRCKDIWVAGTDYWKHLLTTKKYLSASFLVWAQVNKQWAHTLIDTGAMRDFMLFIFTKWIKIQLQQKKRRDTYKVTFIDDTALSYNQRVVDYKTEDTQLQIRSHVQNMWFNITLINKHNVVLHLLWLHNIN